MPVLSRIRRVPFLFLCSALASTAHALSLKPLADFGETDYDQEYRHVRISPDGSRILAPVVCNRGGYTSQCRLELWDVTSGQRIAGGSQTRYVEDAAFSPDGKMLLVAFYDGVDLLDPATLKKVRSLTREKACAAAFLPDGSTALLLAGDGTTRIVELASGKEKASWKGSKCGFGSLAVSPDGKRAIVSRRNGDFQVEAWDLSAPGTQLWRVGESEGGVLDQTAVMSSDGTALIVQLGSKYAKMDTGSGTKSWVTDRGIGPAAFSSDGSSVLVPKYAEIMIVESNTGEPVTSATLPGSAGVLAYSADGKSIVTDMKIWGTRKDWLGANISAQKDSLQVYSLSEVWADVEARREQARRAAEAAAKAAADLAEAERLGDGLGSAGKNAESLAHYVKALELSKPGSEPEARIREKAIHAALAMEAPPPVPEEARRRTARAQAFVEDAKDEQGYRKAAAEFEEAIRAAPWLPSPYFNLAVVQEKFGAYAGAIRSLKLYLLAAPEAPDAKAVQTKIYKLEAKQETAK